MTPVPSGTPPAGAVAVTSIVRRLMIGLTLTIGMSSAITVALFAAYELRQGDADLRRSVEQSITEFAQLVEPALWDLDMERASRIGDAFSKDPRVVRLTIHETTRDTWYRLDRGAGADTVSRTQPVVHDGRTLGEVSIAFSRATYRREIWRQVGTAFAVSFIAVLATLFGVRLLVRRLLHRPLAELSDVVSAYATGNYTPSVAAIRYAEFRPFAAVLDTMGETIVGHLHDLQAANVALSAEVTTRQDADRALSRRNDELAALNRFLDLAAAGVEPSALFERACRELNTILDLPQSVAGLFDETGDTATIVAEHALPARPSLAGTVIPTAGNAFVRELLQGRPLVSEHAAGDPRLSAVAPLLAGRDAASLLALPLVIDGLTVGAIVLASTRPRSFTPSEITLASSVAAQVASALARHRAHAAESLLRAAIEQTPESVVITDIDARIVYVNPAFSAVSGFSRAEAIGQHPRLQKSGKHDDAFYAELWSTLRAGVTWHGQLTNRRKNGELFVEDALIAPVRDERGAVANYIAVKRDITRELEREEQFRHAQRMEAVGQLAGGIAHDFNNILGAVIMQLEMLEMEHELPETVTASIRDVRASVDRAANLTRQLLMFSRRQTMSVRPHDLNGLVANLLRMLMRVIGESITVSFVQADAAVYFEGDAGMIEQVVMNLCVNARDAMPDGGRLTITTSLVVLDAGSALPHAHPDARAGRFASLEVADTGHGMSVETQRRIFEPFFTTKDVGKGTGLGLATTHGLVSQHHGWIEVESEPDRGSTFHVFLPALEKVPDAEQPDAEPLVRGGSATILVVEDEALIRQMVVRSLRRLGYRVLEVENGAEALEMWADEQGRVDLVLTDMVMPGGLSGIDLSRQLQRMKPDLKVVIMSGYATRLVGDESVLTRDIEFLSKPFSLATLGEVVRRALDRADGDGRREGGREEPAPSRRRGPRARPGPTKK